VLNYDIYGTKLTAVVKPTNAVSLTTRYVLQRGKAAIFHAGFDSNGVINGEVDGKRLGTPQHLRERDVERSKAVYVQANGSVGSTRCRRCIRGSRQCEAQTSAMPTTTTSRVTGSSASRSIATRPAGPGHLLSRQQLRRIVCRSACRSARARARRASASVFRRRLAEKTVLSGKLGYIESKNGTPRYADFRGPLAYVSVQHAFLSS